MMKIVFALAAVVALACAVEATVYFKDDFSDGLNGWVKGDADGEMALSAGEWHADADASVGLSTTQDAKKYAWSKKFDESFSNKGKDLVLQFTARNPQALTCGGGYLKLLPGSTDQAGFNGETPYYVMAGGDWCGPSVRKVHFILNDDGENHNHNKEVRADLDKKTHLYTFHIKADNTYEIFVDGTSKQSGSIEEDWDILPPRMINDPNESKPEDWVDEATMDDPEDTKPSDWDDEPEMIPDADAEMPSDWDEELDGEWVAPLVDNPNYKGEWKPKRIPNPDYKGPWEHPQIENPDFDESKVDNLHAFEDIGMVGIDIWQVESGTIFDCIIVTDSIEEANDDAEACFHSLKDAENEAFDAFESARREKEEEERKAREAEREAREAEEAAAREEELAAESDGEWEEEDAHGGDL